MKMGFMFTALFRIACVIVLGIISALGMPPTYYWWALLIGLSVFYIFYAGTGTARMAALLGFFYSIGYFTTGLFWVGNALLVEGNSYRWVWPISVIGLPTILSLFYALALGVCRKFSNPLTVQGLLLFIVAMTVAEWGRGHLFSGFPWNMVSHTWVHYLSILQLVGLGGASFLSFLTFFWFVLPGWGFVSSSSVRLKIFLTLLLVLSFSASYVYGAFRLSADKGAVNSDITVRIVQPNIPQHLKWKAELQDEHFNTLIGLSDPYRSSVSDGKHKTYIIWPETAISPPILRSPAAGDIIQKTLASFPHDAFLITGALRTTNAEDGTELYHNSLLVLDGDKNGLAIYDKTKLVPFGEYIPFQKYIPIKPVAEFSGFAPGSGAQTIPLSEDFSISPLICYEVIFADRARGGDKRPDLIVNITNDAWYGDSAGPRQHLAQSIIRAVENGTPLARSANTGISALISPYGHILQQADIGQKAALSQYLPLPSPEAPLYRKWNDWPLLAFICILMFCCIIRLNH